VAQARYAVKQTCKVALLVVVVGAGGAAGAWAQDDDGDAVAPKVPGKTGTASASCWKMEAGLADALVSSFKAAYPVGFGDAVDVYRPSRPRCQDETTAKEVARLKDVLKLAPPAKKGKSSPQLTALVQRALARKGNAPSRYWGRGGDPSEETTVVSSVAVDARKKLVNGSGTSLGTTQRVSVVVRVNGTDTCLELRGDWRNSTLKEDQDDPEYVVLERMNGGAMGWRNLSNRDFMDLTPAWLVACPAGKP